MPGLVKHRALLEPSTLRDALRVLHDEGPVVPMAGCTDLYVSLNAGALNGTRFVNLWPLRELRGIARLGAGLRIGALTTYADLRRSALVNQRLPMLAAAAADVGGVQIQNRGTIGGNVANASPAGDSLPVLAVADALVELASVSGTRLVPFTAFYTSYRQSVARADELIVALHVPAVQGPQWFRKVGTRAAQAISKVVMAGVGGASPRVAMGSVAPTVIRLPRTEAALAARTPIADAQRVLRDEVHPIDDIRSTAAYRRSVAANLLAEFWAKAGPRPARRRR